MEKLYKKSVVLLVVIFFSIGGVSFADETSGVSSDTIKIGTFSSLTGSASLWGKTCQLGYQLVFNEVNAQGGIHGRKLKWYDEDDSCEATKAAAATKKLITVNDVFMLYVGTCTPSVDAVMYLVEQYKIPLLGMATGSGSFIRPQNTSPASKYTFGGHVLNMNYQFETLVDWLVSHGTKKIAIIYHPDSWGMEGYKGAVSAMERHGLKFVAEEMIERNATDASVQVLKIRNAQPEAVLLVLYFRIAPIFVRQAHELGLKAKLAAAIGSVMDNKTFKDNAGTESMKEFYYVLAEKDLPDGPGLAEYRARLLKAFPGQQEYINTPMPYRTIGTANTVVEALKRSGKDLTRSKFINAMLSLKKFETGTFADTVTFTDEDRAATHKGAVVKYDGVTAQIVHRP